MWFNIKYHYRIIKEKFIMWVAWLLPRHFVRWCYIRVVAHATSGKYGSTIVTEISAMGALKRWGRPNDV